MSRNEPASFRMFIGNKLLTLRQGAGLTQADVAERLDVSRGAVYQYERGIITPSIEILVAYSEVFDVTVGLNGKDTFTRKKIEGSMPMEMDWDMCDLTLVQAALHLAADNAYSESIRDEYRRLYDGATARLNANDNRPSVRGSAK